MNILKVIYQKLWKTAIPMAAGLLLLGRSAGADIEYGIAGGYPNDVGIEGDPAVIFTEDFEEGSLDGVLSNWEYSTHTELMSLTSDRPPASGGSQSLEMQGSADFYQRILPGYDEIYIRFYAKFDAACSNVHHWVWLGGHNPSTAWPWPRAGERPVGEERWSTGVEPMGDSWAWDFYTYWMHMRTNPGTMYWGNSFSGRPSPYPAAKGQWVAVEFMVKMNDPATSFNGEQAFWIDGERKNHLGEGFPRGEWIWDGFYPDPSCTPSGPCDPDGSAEHCCTDFEGFQWRLVPELNINYVWLEHYVDSDPGCACWFDDVVVATSYIGPMVDEVVSPDDAPDGAEPVPDAGHDDLSEPPPDAAPDAAADTVPDTPADPAADAVSDSHDAPADEGGAQEGEGGDGCGCLIV